MTVVEAPERRVRRTTGDYRWLMGLAVVTGCAALVGWGWAIVLALVPVRVPVPGDGSGQKCGSPALFDRAAMADSLGDDDERFDTYWSGLCAEKVSQHIREAVGLSVVTAPLSALWVWSACTLPRRREEIASATAELQESAATAELQESAATTETVEAVEPTEAS